MRENLAQSLKWVLKSEGGYSNTPRDPGGPTNLGIIQREYNAYLLQHNWPIKSVRGITLTEATDIYAHKYWDTVQGDKLPSGLDYACFDEAVNSGPHKAITQLQESLNAIGHEKLAVDGILGNVTLQAISNVDTEHLLREYVKERLTFLQHLGIWSTFGPGWLHRLFGQPGNPGVLKDALSLVSTHTPVSVEAPPTPTALPTPTPKPKESLMDFSAIEAKIVAFFEMLVAFIQKLIAGIAPVLSAVSSVTTALKTV